MTETWRLEQRIARLERQLALTKRIANITLGTFVFEGPQVKHARLVPDGVIWEEHADRSSWMTLGEMMSARGFLPEHEFNIAHLQACVDAGAEDYEIEYALAPPGGPVIWQLGRGVIVYNPDGTPSTLEAIAVDITERKRLEDQARTRMAADVAALRQAEQAATRIKERLELSILGSKTCTWDFELPDGTIAGSRWVFTNVYELVGYTSAEDQRDFPSALALLIPAERQAEIVGDLQRHLDGTSRSWERVYPVRFKDGSERWHLSRGVIQRDADGRATRLTGVSIDITDRMQIDRELRDSEQRFRAVFENAAVGISISTTAGVFVDCNDMLCKLVGRPRDELIGRHVASVVLPDEIAAADARVRDLVSGAASHYSFDRELHHADGTAVWINFTFSVMSRDASGTPNRLLGVLQDITSRKDLEQDLRRTKERLELGVRGSGTTIFDLDLPQPELATSARMTPRHGPRATLTLVGWENFGYDPATDITEPDRIGAMLHHPDDRQRADEVTQGYLSGALPKLETEYRIRHADGSYSWRLVRGQARHDAAGRPTRLIGSMVDITELKRIETVLRESEQRFRAMFENAAVGLSITSTEGIIQDCNATLCGIFGFSRDELIGQHGPRFLFPYDVDASRERLRALVAGEVPFYTLDKHFRRRDGAMVWVNVTFSIMSRDPAGRPDRVLGIYLDITERMELEDDLRRTRERMELGIRGSGTTIFEIELPNARLDKATLSLINGWEQFGYDPPPPLTEAEQVRALLVHPDDQAKSHATTARYLRGETPQFESEYRIIHKDGTISWWLTRGEAIRAADGTPERLLGSMVNITERKRIEDELEAARRSAELANRAKDEFLANVSHEIRTPMNAILGMTELALDASETAHQRQLLSTVKVAARNLLHVINDLLDFSKITAGKLALDHADFSLRAAIGDTLRALAVRAHRKGLELACNVRPDVPDLYFGDAGRVRQILMNLVGNAIKFTPRGEVVVQVMLDREPAADGDAIPLRFTVRDTGIGIAPDKHASIFRAFEQEDASTTRKFGGTGLGLTISSQLATLMGGQITVESEPGRGSAFSFTALISRSSRPEWPGPSSRGPLEGLEVLVVDDSATSREIVIEWLLGWHMRPVAAGDAAAALEALERAQDAGAPFALVLLDGRMPDIDGVTLAHTIGARFGRSAHRLILLGSDPAPGLAAREREAGIHACLLKPVQQAELLDAIWEVMSASTQLAPDVPPAEPTRAAPRASGLRVLIAEDNELNVALLRELLAQRGHRVEVAGDGRTALALATKRDAEYDVMLLDLHMPELDGFEVVHAIRERERATGRHVPIIALTARSSARDRDAAFAAGMDDFLSKPLEVTALWAAIDRVTLAARPRERVRLLDARVITQTCGGRPAVFERLCEVFRRSVPEQTAATRGALDDRDFPRLRTAAHMLAGTLSAFSTVTGAIASTLEDAAADEDLERCTALVVQLEASAAQLLDETRGVTLEALGR